MTLEEARDSLAQAIVRAAAHRSNLSGRSAGWGTGPFKVACRTLALCYGAPTAALAGRIGRRYLVSLNDALRPHGLEVLQYGLGFGAHFLVRRTEREPAEGRTP